MITRDNVLARLRAGHEMYMQFADGRRVRWFENPHECVPDAIMQSVLQNGGIAEAGDSLFGLPDNSQIWLVEDVGREP